jgi:hypothetical protein
MPDSRHVSPNALSLTDPSPLRVAQIIVLAIAMGAASFLAIALVMVREPAGVGEPFLAWVGLVLATVALLGRLLYLIWADGQAVRVAIATGLPARAQSGGTGYTTRANGREALSGEALALLPPFQTRLIVCVALLEGAIIVNLIAYMLERQSYNLIAALVLLAYILLHLPTQLTYVNWVRRIVDRAARTVDR